MGSPKSARIDLEANYVYAEGSADAQRRVFRPHTEVSQEVFADRLRICCGSHRSTPNCGRGFRIGNVAGRRRPSTALYSDQPLIQKHRDSTIESCPVASRWGRDDAHGASGGEMLGVRGPQLDRLVDPVGNTAGVAVNSAGATGGLRNGGGSPKVFGHGNRTSPNHS